MFRKTADGLRADRAPGTVGAARRRRDRRLFAFLKHERLSVAMNMATVQHHSYMKSAVVDFCVQVGSPLAPVTEYVAPAPAVALSVPSQQLRPATVATGVNLDVTGMVYPQFSSTAVDVSASQVVGSLPLGKVFAAPVFNQVHQEQLAGGGSRVAHTLPPAEEFTEPVCNPVHQEQFPAGETTENIPEIPVVQEQVILGVRPDPLAEPPHWFIPGLEAHCPDDDGAPSLSLPSLADRAAEVVDSSSLRFLTDSALEARIKEDEESRKAEEQEMLKTMTEEEARRELRTLLAVPAPRRTAEQEERSRACRAVLAAAHKRKKKKRRKKKLPKASLPSRAARSWISGHSSTSSSWYVYSGGVMCSVACESSFLLGMYWLLQHSANSVLDCAYCLSFGVKVATFLWTWWKKRVVLPSMLAGFAGYDALRAVFPSFVALADEARGDSTGAVLVQGDVPVVFASGAFHQTTHGDGFTFVFVFYAELGSTADTCTASVYGAAHLRVVSAIRAWLVLVWIWQTQSRAGSTVGFSCSQLQLRSSYRFTVPLNGPDGAYESVWDSVKPVTGKFLINISSTKRSLVVYAC